MEAVARRLWLTLHAGEQETRREQKIFDFRLPIFDYPGGVGHESNRQSTIVDPPSARHSSLVTRHLLNTLQLNERENTFRRAERRARLSEALRRLGEALYPEPLQARDAEGYRFILKDEFDRLRPDPVWFDAERKATLRQDLGLDPAPEEFLAPEEPETSEPPGEFSELPGEFSEPPSEFSDRQRRELLRETANAGWRRQEIAQWEQDHTGILLTPEEAAEMDAGRFSVEAWKAQHIG
jgi:hypothetical protein